MPVDLDEDYRDAQQHIAFLNRRDASRAYWQERAKNRVRDERTLANALLSVVEFAKKNCPLTAELAAELKGLDMRKLSMLAEYALRGGFSIRDESSWLFDD